MKKRNNQKPARQFYKRLASIALLIFCCAILLNAFKARSLTASLSVLGRVSGMHSARTATVAQPEITVDLLTPNTYSRPQKALTQVNSIVIHYVGNAGSTATANRDYFENLRHTGTTSASSHFVVGIDGSIVQCVPLDEISYASNHRNRDTISIEVCHPDDSGKFSSDTIASLTKLVGWLLDVYDLEKDDVIRHYDVTGKVCPKYYVEHEDAWENLKQKFWDYYQKHK